MLNLYILKNIGKNCFMFAGETLNSIEISSLNRFDGNERVYVLLINDNIEEVKKEIGSLGKKFLKGLGALGIYFSNDGQGGHPATYLHGGSSHLWCHRWGPSQLLRS